LRQIKPAVREEVQKQVSGELPVLSERHFNALKRILDHEEPAYRM